MISLFIIIIIIIVIILYIVFKNLIKTWVYKCIYILLA